MASLLGAPGFDLGPTLVIAGIESEPSDGEDGIPLCLVLCLLNRFMELVF